MLITKTKSGRSEASATVKGYDVRLMSGVRIPMILNGYGNTHTEAIDDCFDKIRVFLNPEVLSLKEEGLNEDDAMERLHEEELDFFNPIQDL